MVPIVESHLSNWSHRLLTMISTKMSWAHTFPVISWESCHSCLYWLSSKWFSCLIKWLGFKKMLRRLWRYREIYFWGGNINWLLRYFWNIRNWVIVRKCLNLSWKVERSGYVFLKECNNFGRDKMDKVDELFFHKSCFILHSFSLGHDIDWVMFMIF